MQVSINGMTMAYEDLGAGPAVLLLPGFPVDIRSSKTHFQALAEAGFRVIVPELRGSGAKSAAPVEGSLDGLGDDVIGLLNVLGIGRAAIVGWSWGTEVLNTLLKRHSQRVAAAVFVDPLGREDNQAETECLPKLVTNQTGQDITDCLLDFFREVKRDRPRCPIFRQVA